MSQQRSNMPETGQTGYWFAQIPLDIIRDPRLSAGAVRLYANLAGYANAEGVCWPGKARLAKDLNVSVRTIYNYTRELSAAGHIIIKRRGRRRSNLYTLPELPCLGDRQNAVSATKVIGNTPAKVTGNTQPENHIQKNKTQLEREQELPDGAVPKHFDEMCKIYEAEIGPLTPLTRRRLTDFAGMFSAAEFEEAVAEAIFYNAKHKFAYATKILQRKQRETQKVKASRAEIVANEEIEREDRNTTVPKPPEPAIFAPLCELFDDAEATFSLADTWFVAMGQLQLQMNRPAFDWVRRSEVVALEDKTLVIRAPSVYAKCLLEQQLLPTLSRTVSDIAGYPLTLRIVAADEWCMQAA